MITWDEVKQINSKLVLENGGSPEEDSSCEEISSIVYYTDVIECEGTAVIHRNIRLVIIMKYVKIRHYLNTFVHYAVCQNQRRNRN